MSKDTHCVWKDRVYMKRYRLLYTHYTSISHLEWCNHTYDICICMNVCTYLCIYICIYWTHCNVLQRTATCQAEVNAVTLSEVRAVALPSTRAHTATRCNTLQHTATHCNTLQRTATRCNTLQHTATHCNILQHTATRCNMLQHTATHCTTLQHTMLRCVPLRWPRTSIVTCLVRVCGMTRSCMWLDAFICVIWPIHIWCGMTGAGVWLDVFTCVTCRIHLCDIPHLYVCHVRQKGLSLHNCNAKQHNATHCNTLQHTAAHCNTQSWTLQHTATCRRAELMRGKQDYLKNSTTYRNTRNVQCGVNARQRGERSPGKSAGNADAGIGASETSRCPPLLPRNWISDAGGYEGAKVRWGLSCCSRVAVCCTLLKCVAVWRYESIVLTPDA